MLYSSRKYTWVAAIVAVAAVCGAEYISELPLDRDSIAVSNGSVFVAISVGGGELVALYSLSRRDVFGQRGGRAHAVVNTCDLASRIFFEYTYFRWAQGDRYSVPITATPAKDALYDARMHLKAVKKLLARSEESTYPLSESARSLDTLVEPALSVYADPLMTFIPFVVTRYVELRVIGKINLYATVGLNFMSVLIEPDELPMVEFIMTLSNAPLVNTAPRSLLPIMHASYRGKTVWINVPADQHHKPELYDSAREAAKAFFDYEDYRDQLSVGQLATINYIAHRGCRREADMAAYVFFAMRFASAWYRMLALGVDTFVTDLEVTQFLSDMHAWSSHATICMAGASPFLPGPKMVLNDAAASGLELVPMYVLKSLARRKWGSFTLRKDSDSIMTILHAESAMWTNAIAPVKSADGFTTVDLIAGIISNYYREFMHGHVLTSDDRRLMAVGLNVFMRYIDHNIQTGRALILKMTTMCTEHVVTDAYTDMNALMARIRKERARFSVSELFTPCMASLRFDLNYNHQVANIITTFPGYTHVYKVMLDKPNAGQVNETAGQLSRPAVPELQPRMLLDVLFPEVETCVDWDQYNHLILVIPATKTASWVLTSHPIVRGPTFRVPDSSTKKPLFLSYVNASCLSDPLVIHSTHIEDAFIEMSNDGKCKYCGYAILRYSLRGVEDVVSIDDQHMQDELAKGANSSIQYFKSMTPGYYNYLFLSPAGSVVRALGVATETYRISAGYVAGVVIGSIIGIVALVSVVRMLFSFCRNIAREYLPLMNEDGDDEPGSGL